MINETFTCALKDCDVVGTKTTHNQKYCSIEHCRIATNAKIMERYHELQAIKKGKKRICKTCTTELSRYNTSKTCSGCDAKGRKRTNGAIADLAYLVA